NLVGESNWTVQHEDGWLAERMLIIVRYLHSPPKSPTFLANFFFSSRRRHTSSVSAFLLNRSSDLIAYPTTKIRVNATCRKCPHKVHRMEMKTAISCTILRHTKILIAVGV